MSTSPAEPVPVEPDVLEHGRTPEGADITSDRRLYMRLLVFTGCKDPSPLVDWTSQTAWDAVIYQDATNPWGLGLLLMDTDPAAFVQTYDPALRVSPWSSLTPCPHMTMLARSYSIGYESDLEHTLVNRPRSRALNPDWPWVVWYPLRRTGAFAKLANTARD